MTIFAGPGDDGPERDEAYERHKQRAAARQADESSKARELGAIPACANPERRAACAKDLERALRTYFPRAFPLPFSRDHQRVIRHVQTAVSESGLSAIAMPRGSGKTTICERGVLWGLLYAHRRFALLIGADKEKGKESLGKVITELEQNELLLEDFPEIVVPIRALEGLANRCKGQLYRGERTHIGYGRDKLVFASIPGCAASGSILKVGGIIGAVRGANHTTADGSVLRPDVVLIDDPQTRRSAKSLGQCDTRERIISADILGCAGPDKPLSALMTCTVIYKGDTADRLLNREKHPDWKGERCKLLYVFPERLDLWEQYWQLRSDSLLNGGDGHAATEFYSQHRALMDRGAQVAWPERKDPKHLSALETCMCWFFRDKAGFFSEGQNDPQGGEEKASRTVPADQLTKKVNGTPRGTVPERCRMLTAFIDVHEDLLYWQVWGWSDGFTGDLVDYGTWPKQRQRYFRKSECSPSLSEWLAAQDKRPVATVQIVEAVRSGLHHLTAELYGRTWLRADGDTMTIKAGAVDANYGPLTDLVKEIWRTSPFKERFLPSFGRGLGPREKTMDEWKKEPGDRRGDHWMVIRSKQRHHLTFDSNHWKTTLWGRLSVGLGALGCMAFNGLLAATTPPRPKDPEEHRLLVDHLLAEFPDEVTARGRTVEQWSLYPGQDNHWLDCAVGAMVVASTEGMTLVGQQPDAAPRRKGFRMQKPGGR